MSVDPQGQDLVAELSEVMDNMDTKTETATATPDAPPATAEPGVEAVDGSTAPPESPAPDPAPAADAAPAIPVVDPNVIAPPVGGEPFTFSVDRKQVALEGARVVGDDILIPKDVWLHQMVPNYLGDRGAWREEKRGLQREIAAREAGQSEESRRAKALVAIVGNLLNNPEELQRVAENWQVQGPVLMAQAEANATKAELARYRAQEEAAAAEQEEQQFRTRADLHLAQTVEELLAEAGVQWDGIPAEEARWKQFVEALEQDVGFDLLYPRDHRGQRALDEDRVRRAFNREHARSKQQAQVTRVTEKKAALNTAAVAPAKPIAPSPGKPAAKAPQQPTPAARNAQGQFTKQEEPFDAEDYLRKTKFFDD
jgi:hypothetical protein